RDRGAAVEGLAARGHVAQQLRRTQLLAEQVGQPVGFGYERGDSDAVYETERSARVRRIAHAENRAEVAVGRRQEHALLHRARGLHGLHVQDALLEIVRLRLHGLQRVQLGKPRPEHLAGLVVVVETLAVLAPETA